MSRKVVRQRVGFGIDASRDPRGSWAAHRSNTIPAERRVGNGHSGRDVWCDPMIRGRSKRGPE